MGNVKRVIVPDNQTHAKISGPKAVSGPPPSPGATVRVCRSPNRALRRDGSTISMAPRITHHTRSARGNWKVDTFEAVGDKKKKRADSKAPKAR